MNICFCRQNILQAIVDMQTFGISHVTGMLQEPFRQALIAEVAKLPFKKAAPTVNNAVIQQFEVCAFLYQAATPQLETLRLATEVLLETNGKILSDTELMDWKGLDVVIQKYSLQGSLGAHRDLARHPTAIAIWNVTGSCLFEVLENRHGQVIKSLIPRPGDLILLRGASLKPGVEQRPFHRVSSILGDVERISITIRHNLNPQKPISDFSYLNAPDQ